jgi:hypothetical protein
VPAPWHAFGASATGVAGYSTGFDSATLAQIA